MQGSGITIHTSFDTIVSLLLHSCYNDCYINTNRQTINLWCLSRMNQRCDSRPKGDSGSSQATHKATRKFHANDKTTETAVLKHHAII